MEDNLEYIDSYFKGNLHPDQTKQFEQRIANDRNFAEEVTFYLSAKQALKKEIITEKKRWFKELAEQNSSLSRVRQITPVRKLWVYAAAAAVITCIFFAGYILFIKPVSPSQMAKQYIEKKLQRLDVTMGEKDSLQNAKWTYNDGQLEVALEKFKRIVQADSSNFDAKIYSGIVYLRLENYDKALEYFQELEKYTSHYANPATFYHALTLMKRNRPGDKLEAKQLLKQVEQNDLEGKKTAKQWLNKW